MAGLSNTGIKGFIASAKFTGRTIIKKGKEIPEMIEHFLSGFAGYGWKIWEYVKGKWMLEIDSLRVRGTMTVFELLIHKIRAVIGALAITQGQGKIKTVALSDDQSEYLITVEETMSFEPGDFIRCQTWTGNNIKMYHVWVEDVKDNVIHIPIDEFEIDYDNDGALVVHNAPEPGDDIVQFGSDRNTGRQSAIYIHADESGQPAIDVMFGIKSKDWTNCVKVRLGGDIPGTDGLKGFYVENGMIKGTDSSGHVVYCIFPDGTAEFADKAAIFRPDRSGHIAGGAIKWHYDEVAGKYRCTLSDVVLSWENLSDDVKQSISPYIGINGNWWIGDTDTGTKAEAVDGNDGKTPYIKDGNWWIGDNDTGIAAKGLDGKSPYIGENGNWWIGETDTGVKAKAEDGKQGIDGMIIIKSEWAIGVEYRNDETLTEGTRYLNVAMVRDNSVDTGWRAYRCKKTHVGSISNAPGNTEFWEEFPLNVAAIFTSLIIAKDAKIDFLTNNEIRILDANGKVTAGFSGAGSGATGYRIWVGGETPLTASSRFAEDGSGGLAKDNLKWDALGNTVYAGELKGVTGSFKRLNCVDNDGNIMGAIRFGDNGEIWFENCSIRHQAANGPFYASDVWVRGVLGSVGKTAMVITAARTGNIYSEGLSRGVHGYLNFDQKTSAQGATYYDVPLYSPTLNTSGLPVDLIIINHGSTARYNLAHIPGKTVTLINTNDQNSSVYVYSNGMEIQVQGGAGLTMACVGGNQSPDSSSWLGRGWLVTGKYDNQWT